LQGAQKLINPAVKINTAGFFTSLLKSPILTFNNNHDLATKAYVDPNPANKKAWALYEKLGFISKPRPEFLPPDETYLEVTKDLWSK